MTQHITWFLCVLAVWGSWSCASTNNKYEYLPEIPIPTLRKIITQYAYNVITYRTKFFTTLPTNAAHLDEKLPYATATCAKESMIATPRDKQQEPFHIIYDDESEYPVPSTLRSDSLYKKTYSPLVRLKHTQDEESIRIILSKPLMPYISHGEVFYPFGLSSRHNDNYACIECVPDDMAQYKARKAANQALKMARLDE